MLPAHQIDTRERVEKFLRQHRIGLFTIVFTDMAGSTLLKQRLGDREGVALIQSHHAALRSLLAQFPEAEEIGTAGDSFFLVFTRPSDATRFALLLQPALRQLSKRAGNEIADRLGIHIGEVMIEQESDQIRDLYGIQIDIAARVMSLAEPGQILLTRSAFDNARQALNATQLAGIGAICWQNHGRYSLKGIDEPLEICEVGEQLTAPLKPPADSEKVKRFAATDGEPVLGWRPAVDQQAPGTSWVLQEKLGEGGFGEVWRGKHQVTKEQRVFKFCFRADRARSLRREVTLFRLLRERCGEHPHILAVREVYFEQPPFYLMVDYESGGDLRQWIDRQGGFSKIPIQTRLEIIAQIAEGLQAAHEAGIIHRDVKPSNILLRNSGLENVNARLGDFGIGQVVSEEALAGVTKLGFTQTLHSTGSASHSGTFMYLAPEVVAGQPPSPRGDIYALGIVLFQMVIGDFNQPLTTDWEKLVGDPLLRKDLQLCFAGNPADRFSSAMELAKNLRSLEARRADLERQRMEALQRERAAYRKGLARAAALAAIIVLLVGLLAAYAFQQARLAKRIAGSEALQRKKVEEALKQLQVARTEVEIKGKAEEQQRKKVTELVDQSKFAKINEILHGSNDNTDDVENRSGKFSRGLAELARTLRSNPMSEPAAYRLISLLSQISFPTPIKQLSFPSNTIARHHIFSRGKPLGAFCFVSNDWAIINVRDNSIVRSNLEPSQISGLRFAPDGLRLAVTVPSGVKIYSIETNSAPVVIPTEKGATQSSFSPDGSLIAAGSSSKDNRSGMAVKIFDTTTGQLKGGPYKIEGAIYGLRFEDLKGGLFKLYLGMNAITGALGSSVFAAVDMNRGNDEVFFNLSGYNSPNYWDTELGRSHPKARKLCWGEPFNDSAYYESDFNKFFTESMISFPGRIELWNYEPRQLLPQVLPLQRSLRRYSPDAKTIYEMGVVSQQIDDSSSDSVSLRIIDRENPRVVRELPVSPSPRAFYARSNTNQLFYWGSNEANGQAFILDIPTGRSIPLPIKNIWRYEVDSAMRSFYYVSNGVFAVNLQTKDLIWSRPLNVTIDEGGFGDLDLSPNEKFLILRLPQFTSVFSAGDGKELATFNFQPPFEKIAFDPSGEYFALANHSSLKVFKFSSPEKPVFSTDLSPGLRLLKFSPGGRYLGVLHEDAKVSCWSLPEGTKMPPLDLYIEGAVELAFSHDETKIALANGSSAKIYSIRMGVSLSTKMTFPEVENNSYYNEQPGLAFDFSEDDTKLTFATSSFLISWDLPRVHGPVPIWLIDLAEALGRMRFEKENISNPVGMGEFFRLKEQLAASQESNDYIRFGRWLLAPLAERTISPYSSITYSNYWQKIAREHPLLLNDAIAFRPGDTNLLQARIDSLLDEILEDRMYIPGFNSNAKRSLDFAVASDQRFFAELALELNPGFLKAKILRAVSLAKTGSTAEASVALDSIPENFRARHFWSSKGFIAQRDEKNEFALACFDRALATLGEEPNDFPNMHRLRRARRAILLKLGKFAEAGAEQCALLGLKPRDVSTPANLLDLSPFYTYPMKQYFPASLGRPARVISSIGQFYGGVPQGVTEFQGVKFDLRGAIDLYNWSKLQPIPVNQKAARIDLLHGMNSGWTPFPAQNLEVAKISLVYEDGSSEELRVAYGKHLRTSMGSDKEQSVSDGALAWHKPSNPAVYHAWFKNPRPNEKITQIELSDLHGGGYQLLAVTLLGE